MEARNLKYKDLLVQFPLFASLTEVQLRRVCDHSRHISLDESQILFNQGEQAECFYVVLSGRVKLFRVSADGQEKIIEIIPAGGVFAEALVFMEHPYYPVSTAALEASEVIGIDADDYRAILWDSPATCFSLLGDMSIRLHRLIHEIDTLSLHNGSCRVASYLLNSAADDVQTYELDLAKNLIASRLSVKPETFSRIIANFKKQGVVEVDGNRVTILNREALKRISMI